MKRYGTVMSPPRIRRKTNAGGWVNPPADVVKLQRRPNNQIGYKYGAVPPKETLTANNSKKSFSHRTLYTSSISDIDHDPLKNKTTRLHKAANVTGFDIRYCFENTRNSPTYIRWAVVALKEGSLAEAPTGKSAADAAAAAAEPWLADFFQLKTTESSAIGFSIDSYYDNLLRPLNPNKFIKLSEGTINLKEKPVATFANNGNVNNASFKYGHVWVPVNRQIRYDDDAGNHKEQIYFMMWCDVPLDTHMGVANEETPAPSVDGGYRIFARYHDAI